MKTLVRPCPVCGGIAGDLLHHQRFCVEEGYPLPDRYDIVLCRTCGMAFADTSASQADYDRFYQAWSIYERPPGGATPAEDAARLNQTAAMFSEHIPDKQARILDIGCANGGLLEALRALDFADLTGIDPSPSCVAHARRAGFQAFRGDLANLPADIGRFDVVVLAAVLEHLLDVQGAVDAMVDLCADRGRIFLQVPDAAGYADYLHAPFQDFNTEHINHFCAAALRNLMAQRGFDAVFERQLPVAGPSGVMAAVLEAGFARGLDAPSPRPWRTDPAFRPKIEAYIAGSRAILDRMDGQLRAVLDSSPAVAVWGAGQLAMKLLAETALKDAEIVAVVDENPIHHGKRLRGVTVQAPEELTDRTAPIVVATLLHIPGIRDRIAALGLRNPVVTLEGCAPGRDLPARDSTTGQARLAALSVA